MTQSLNDNLLGDIITMQNTCSKNQDSNKQCAATAYVHVNTEKIIQ